MKIRLVFDDWRNKKGESVYNTLVGVDLSMRDFHSGTAFTADIQLDEEGELELKEALVAGYVPVFYVSQ